MVRVCFVLGNITTTEDETRKVLYERCSLLPILNGVFGRYVTQSQDLKDNKEKRNKCEDVVIKVGMVHWYYRPLLCVYECTYLRTYIRAYICM